jgi:hypothetical protein
MIEEIDWTDFGDQETEIGRMQKRLSAHSWGSTGVRHDTTTTGGRRFLFSMLGGKACGARWKYYSDASYAENNRLKLRGLLNRPQRERLPRFQVGILMIGKIEPTITIRAELRLLFPEIQFIEFTSVVFGNLHGY